MTYFRVKFEMKMNNIFVVVSVSFRVLHAFNFYLIYKRQRNNSIIRC